jgi:hypothetical protein
MGVRAALAALLLLVAAPALAAPAPAPPMSFTLIRGAGADCEPDCPQWISAEGEIKPGTAAKFRSFLAGVEGRPPLIINSGGGSVDDALQIGRLVRARHLAVAVGRTGPPAPGTPSLTGQPPVRRGLAYAYPAACFSACTLILAGGVERYASMLANIGVHEVSRQQTRVLVLRRYLVHYRIVDGRKYEVSREIVHEDKQAYASTDIDPPAIDQRIVAYLKEMGQEPKLLDLMRTATPDKIHLMTREDEKATRLVTIELSKPFAVELAPAVSGLGGSPLDPASGSHPTLGASLNAEIESPEASKLRMFYVYFTLRRGGAGVVATFSLLDTTHAGLLYGATVDATRVKRLPSKDKDTTTLFLPNAEFCRLALDGKLYVAKAGAAPDQPDLSAALFAAPVLGVDGIPAIYEEICAPAQTRPANARRPARLKKT